MKTQYFYEYIGDNATEDGYFVGQDYALTIVHRTLWQRLLGLYFNVPFGVKLFISAPMPVLYKDLDEFYKSWNYKFMRVSNES